MERKVLFLDFDGVLFDTLYEVYLINRKVCIGTDIFDEIDKENYKLYSKYKYLVYNIWMFLYYNPLLFNACPQNEIVAKFNTAILNRDKRKEEIFYDKFIYERKKLINEHFDFWKNLERPYDFFYFIKELYETKKADMVIVSKKNKSSIIERFNSYNFNLEKEKIFDCVDLEFYNSKGDFINQYMNKFNYSKAIFVDDNSNNIKSVNNPNVKAITALWGNAQPEAVGLEQNQAIDEIKSFLAKT